MAFSGFRHQRLEQSSTTRDICIVAHYIQSSDSILTSLDISLMLFISGHSHLICCLLYSTVDQRCADCGRGYPRTQIRSFSCGRGRSVDLPNKHLCGCGPSADLKPRVRRRTFYKLYQLTAVEIRAEPR